MSELNGNVDKKVFPRNPCACLKPIRVKRILFQPQIGWKGCYIFFYVATSSAAQPLFIPSTSARQADCLHETNSSPLGVSFSFSNWELEPKKRTFILSLPPCWIGAMTPALLILASFREGRFLSALAPFFFHSWKHLWDLFLSFFLTLSFLLLLFINVFVEVEEVMAKVELLGDGKQGR